ncbi:hypothetical protein K0M31_001476 [Melipona bicolor]|uniref:Uncharacterized protein n=1 Tax=Melipona bicolor TaxID=60889 RepID=A0AA40GFK6_9HYME|nr:hypothetical protein K0M31_001476 [Melipona bicolor]
MNKKYKEEQILTVMQMIVFLLVVFSFFFIILIWCRACSRKSELRYSGHNTVISINSNSVYEPSVDRPPSYNEASIDSRPLQSDSIYEPSMDRPPSYNEACVAPPIKSPFNKISMVESPPVPETPHSSYSANQTFPVTNHI